MRLLNSQKQFSHNRNATFLASNVVKKQRPIQQTPLSLRDSFTFLMHSTKIQGSAASHSSNQALKE